MEEQRNAENGNPRKFDLQDRLITFACICLQVCELLPRTKSGQNLEYQLSKSGTASALIYGEAQAAESNDDFVHKLKMALKEIRESEVNLKIIKLKGLVKHNILDVGIIEAGELRAIFIASIKTASKKSRKVRM